MDKDKVESSICSLDKCIISGKKKGPQLCIWAIKNEKGEEDCGYG